MGVHGTDRRVAEILGGMQSKFWFGIASTVRVDYLRVKRSILHNRTFSELAGRTNISTVTVSGGF
jgi:hypothetical protein